MNVDEFQNKYHAYETFSKEEAELECEKVNNELDGGKVEVVHFSSFKKYTLMLCTAKSLLNDTGFKF